MSEWYQELPENFFHDIITAYYGNIMVIDSSGKLLYGRLPPESKLDIDGTRYYGKTIFDLEKESIFVDSAIAEALRTGRRAIKLVESSIGPSLLAVSAPVKDSEGKLKMVVTYSQDEEITTLILQRYEQERDRLAQAAKYLSQKSGKNTIVYKSEAIREIIAKLDKAAPTDATILFTGESGTGKEVFSRYVHNKSARCDYPFIPVNCAAFPKDLIESELFGYAKGAFTGASREGKAGLFELAGGGTLFLDEIGDLSLPAQAKLLRVLETGEIQKVGSEKVVLSRARIVVATNKDLLQLVREGSFRKDLYYRLNVFPVTIPPIRERPDDIEPLANYFLDIFNKKYGTSKHLHESAVAAMKAYAWPGNIREIRNVIERLVIVSWVR